LSVWNLSISLNVAIIPFRKKILFVQILMQPNESISSKSAVVIGSGVAGLAAAIRLANMGFDVTVFEANNYVGGKMYEWENEGFRFDMGPSVFTMPEYVEELFRLTNRDPKNYIEIKRPELPFNYFFDDGLVLNFYADVEKLIAEVSSKTSDDEATIRKYLDNIQTKFDLTNTVFLQNSLHILSNYLSKEAFRGLMNFGKVEVFKSMDEANRNNFADEHTIRLFNSFASYLGSNPFKAPGVLNVISHFQLNAGIYLPVGGMRSIINAMYKLANELGVNFRLNAPVQEILIESGKANGVRVNDKVVYSDVVISNMDVYNAYKQLMPLQKGPSLVLNHQKSHSVMVFLWGMKKNFSQLTLHNMILANNMRDEYNTMFNNADIGDDFTTYIYVSSKCNASDAPAGCENWYILINAPHNQNQDWAEIQQRVKTRLLERLKITLGEDVSEHIAFEKVLDPPHHQQQTNSAFGAIYGNSFNSKFSVFMRHPNFTNKIKNLYFCGGTVHPGGGVPLSVLSAKIVADIIEKKNKSNKIVNAG
jgi:phytoene desaturase